MDSADVERIAKAVLRELGTGNVPVTVTAGQNDRWIVAIGGSEQTTLTIKGGPGTTAHFIREQIFQQFQSR